MQKIKYWKYVQILAASKNQADWEIPAFTENQADWAILALTKNQADWEILAFTKNQADWEILEFAENQAGWEILAGVEIPSSGEKPAFVEKLAKLEKQAARLLFRLGGISNCWLLPLMSSFSSLLMSMFSSDGLMSTFSSCWCWISSMKSPSEEWAVCVLLLWVHSLPYRTGCFNGPPCQEMAKIHAATKNQAAAWFFRIFVNLQGPKSQLLDL